MNMRDIIKIVENARLREMQWIDGEYNYPDHMADDDVHRYADLFAAGGHFAEIGRDADLRVLLGKEPNEHQNRRVYVGVVESIVVAFVAGFVHEGSLGAGFKISTMGVHTSARGRRFGQRIYKVIASSGQIIYAGDEQTEGGFSVWERLCLDPAVTVWAIHQNTKRPIDSVQALYDAAREGAEVALTT